MSSAYWNGHWRIEHFDCSCMDHEHTLRVMFDKNAFDLEDLELYLEHTWPTRPGFWARLKEAAKYVWRGDRNWTYGSLILKPKDVERLRHLMIEFDAQVWKINISKAKKLKKENNGGNQTGM